MNTICEVSTISYNSHDFLVAQLNKLVEQKILQFWALILHKPEDDEAGKKYHYHVYGLPARRIQTMDLQELLIEPTTYNKDPLGCLPWTKSDFDNWYLYILHDIDYLARKHQTRVYTYKFDEVESSDKNYLYYLVKSIDMIKMNPLHGMYEAMKEGLSYGEFFCRGSIPVQQVDKYEYAWDLIKSPSRTRRNCRKGHENV